MAEASIRELRNHGGEVIDRVAAGERVTITRDGKAVAELRPLALYTCNPRDFEGIDGLTVETIPHPDGAGCPKAGRSSAP